MEKKGRKKLRSEELKQKKKKKTIQIVILVLIIILIFLIIIIYIQQKNKKYIDYQISLKHEWIASTLNHYLHYKNGVMKYNKDGAEAISANGQLLWNVAYNMKDPIADVCGSYTVIGDRGSKTFFIIDETGKSTPLTALQNITNVSVSEQGYAVIMTSEETIDYFYLYNMGSTSSSDNVTGGRTFALSNGFPLDIAIASDSKKIVTSYLRADGDQISSWITFYNFGDIGNNYVNYLTGADKAENNLMHEVEFLSSDYVLGLRDNGFSIYYVPETYSNKGDVDIDIEGEIKSIAYNNEMICVVLKSTSAEKYQVECYNLLGTKILDFKTNIDFDKITISGKDIVFYNKLSFYIYDRKGNEKMHGSFEKNVEYIYPLNGNDKFVLVGDGYLENMELLKVTK